MLLEGGVCGILAPAGAQQPEHEPAKGGALARRQEEGTARLARAPQPAKRPRIGREAGQQALLKLLKGKLGTGGTLEDGKIIIQGDHRERIVEILNELGYKAKVAGG